MPNPSVTDHKKRPRGRPATIKAVRDIRVSLSQDQDERFLRYRAHVEAQTPGFIPSDSALGRAIFLMGLDAWERQYPQQASLPLTMESTTKKS
jgi:hypothetical protein